jgi:hypothetical protein
LPTRGVLVEWRCRDIERSIGGNRGLDPTDVKWLLAELRGARTVLTEIIALAHDVNDTNGIGQQIRFAANRALGLYEPGDTARLKRDAKS